MIRYLLDLGDSLKALLLKGDTIIALEEFDYSVHTLDLLYVRLKMYVVDELIVITHNILSGCLYKQGCIAFQKQGQITTPLSIASKRDIEQIMEVSKAAGVTNVKFVDKIGYYEMLGEKSICYVEKASGMYRLICVDGEVKDYRICSDNALKEVTNNFCEKNHLETITQACELYNTDALLAFTNSIFVLDDKKTVSDLSLFSYALICVSTGSSYGAEVLENTLENILSVSEKRQEFKEEPKEKGEFNEEIQTESLEDAKFAMEPSVFSMKNQYIISVSLMVLTVVGILSSLGLYGMHLVYNKKATTFEESLVQLESEAVQLQELVKTYEYCLSTGNNRAFELLNNVEGEIAQNNGELMQISMNQQQTSLTVFCDSNEEADLIVNSITAKYPMLSFESSTQEAGTSIVISSVN